MQNKFPEKVTICEVVTRDGFQTAPEIYPVEEKVRIIEEVVDAGRLSSMYLQATPIIRQEPGVLPWNL